MIASEDIFLPNHNEHQTNRKETLLLTSWVRRSVVIRIVAIGSSIYTFPLITLPLRLALSIPVRWPSG